MEGLLEGVCVCSGGGAPGRSVCDSPAAAAAAAVVEEDLDPNPKALKAPENVDLPSRFATLPPLATIPPLVAEVGTEEELTRALLLFRPWE